MGIRVSNHSKSKDLAGQSSLLDLLPFGYESFRITEDKRPLGFRFYNNSVTISADLHGKEIIVCGEGFDRQTATAKAISELIERSVLIENAISHPFIHKTSNGWAAHFEEESARLNAILEVVERDAILAQWYSCTPFIEIQIATLPNSILSWMKDELAKSEFPILKILTSTKGLGPSVTCILMDENGYGVSGHSSKFDLLSSVENAIGEACRAAHLTLRNSHFGDTVILKNGAPAKRIDPGAHAVYYAYQESFPQWMFGENIPWLNAVRAWNSRISDFKEGEIKNFTVETRMTDPAFVCFARHAEAIDLSWGPTTLTAAQKLSESPRLNHYKINFQPHPIS